MSPVRFIPDKYLPHIPPVLDLLFSTNHQFYFYFHDNHPAAQRQRANKAEAKLELDVCIDSSVCAELTHTNTHRFILEESLQKKKWLKLVEGTTASAGPGW